MTQVLPVILCGGSGTRLWPLSRSGFPKQFLVLSGDDSNQSLFQQAINRIHGVANKNIEIGKTLIVTNEEHRFLALDQLRELKRVDATLLLEPLGRNTAPALTLAALYACEQGGDPVLVVTPADQTVVEASAFTAALEKAIAIAQENAIAILGITPKSPETGYGYIKAISTHDGQYTVERFVEKPDAQTAKTYMEAGGYFWNGGMFVLKASVWLSSMEAFRPDILEATKNLGPIKRLILLHWQNLFAQAGIYLKKSRASQSTMQ